MHSLTTTPKHVCMIANAPYVKDNKNLLFWNLIISNYSTAAIRYQNINVILQTIKKTFVNNEHDAFNVNRKGRLQVRQNYFK